MNPNKADTDIIYSLQEKVLRLIRERDSLEVKLGKADQFIEELLHSKPCARGVVTTVEELERLKKGMEEAREVIVFLRNVMSWVVDSYSYPSVQVAISKADVYLSTYPPPPPQKFTSMNRAIHQSAMADMRRSKGGTRSSW